jgi:SAM-dependent methyltransferase
MPSYADYQAKTIGLTSYVDASLNRRFRAIIRAIPANSRALSVACGSGTELAALEKKGCKTRGIDIAPAAVKVARAKNLDVVLGDVDTFETDPAIGALMLAEYDVVIFSKCLPYLKRKNELMKALRTKMVIVNQRNPSHWRARLRRWRGVVSEGAIEDLPYITADGHVMPQTSMSALRQWGESYGFRSKVLLGNFFRSRDAVTLFYR